MLLRGTMFAAALAALIAFAVSSRGDTSSPDAVPPPPSTAHDPFKPHDPGPPEARWRAEDLRPEERAQLEASRPTAEAQSMHDAYNTAVAESVQEAQSSAAAHELGADSSEQIGVIP